MLSYTCLKFDIMDVQLNRYFKLSEFACKCGCVMPRDVLSNVLLVATELEKLRIKMGTPIIINSGYRCKAYNTRVGGSSGSYHMRGMAVDIRSSAFAASYLFSVVKEQIGRKVLSAGGLKQYSSFVHYDIRGSLTLF